MIKITNSIFLTLFSFVALAVHALAEPSVSVTLEPKAVPLNMAAELVASIENGKQGVRPQLPDVKGLIFTPSGQSSQITIVNGDMTSVLNFSYQVTAKKEGNYQIPAVSIKVGGKTISSNALALKVTAPQKGAAQSDLLDQGGLSDEEKKKTAFLTIQRSDNKGRDYLYVGESTPVLIRAYLRSGVRVRGLNKPSISSEAFTLSALSDEPEQEQTIIDGVRYHIFSWYGNLSGIKAGDYDLKTKLKAIVSVPSKRSSNRQINDPFFDDFFTRYENKDLILESDMQKTKVLSPPLKGRPDSFTGAVGKYKIKATPFPTALETGEAVSLEVFIEGKGNFDRVSKPSLMPAKGWKTYKENAKLEPGDIVDFQARKHFKIPAVVNRAGDLEAYFQFSYFDPEVEEYKTIKTETQAIEVRGKTSVKENAVITNHEDAVASTVPNLPAIKEDIGNVFTTHSSLYEKNWFKFTGLVLIFALVSGVFVALVYKYRGKHSESYSRRAFDREQQLQLSQIQNSIDEGKVLEFFQQCRFVLQNQIVKEKGGKAEAITVSELIENFPSSHTAIEVFKKADEVEFSTQEESAESMMGWLGKTQTALKELQDSSVSIHHKRTAWGQVSSSN